MVCKDVLKLLDLKKVKPLHLAYVKIENFDLKPHMDAAGNAKVQVSEMLLAQSAPTCEVCAIGGAMVAATMRLNDVVKDDFPYHKGNKCTFYESFGFSDDKMGERAAEVFGQDLLREMENAFENGAHGYFALETTKGRFKAIYENIIENEGKKFTKYDDSRIVWQEGSSR